MRSQSEKNFGELGSVSTPEFWGLMALARGFDIQLDDPDAPIRLETTQRTLEEFLSPDDPGGWTLFRDDTRHAPSGCLLDSHGVDGAARGAARRTAVVEAVSSAAMS